MKIADSSLVVFGTPIKATSNPMDYNHPNVDKPSQTDAIRYPLQFCSKCQENTVEVKIYTNKKGIKMRIWYCINHGHGLIDTQILKGDELCAN